MGLTSAHCITDPQAGLARMKADLKRWAGPLGEDVNQAVDKLAPGKTVEQKAELRELLWKLREQTPAGSDEVREAYEKVRNIALDNSFERGLKGVPSAGYNISPKACDIPNFQVVNERLSRGGQPDQDGMDWLDTQGVHTVVDLRGDDRDNQWFPGEWQNKKIYRIDVPDFGEARFEQVEQFLDIVNNPVNGKVYVHCKAGIGRTGMMIACWRVSQGIDVDEALRLESINSYAGSMKQEKFVREFAAYWKNKQEFRTAA